MKKELANIRGYKSLRLLMEPGEYYYCACGRSNNNPFCDGSHTQTAHFKPIPIKIRFKQEVKWCDCRRSATLPFCDNAHRELDGYVAKKITPNNEV